MSTYTYIVERYRSRLNDGCLLRLMRDEEEIERSLFPMDGTGASALQTTYSKAVCEGQRWIAKGNLESGPRRPATGVVAIRR